MVEPLEDAIKGLLSIFPPFHSQLLCHSVNFPWGGSRANRSTGTYLLPCLHAPERRVLPFQYSEHESETTSSWIGLTFMFIQGTDLLVGTENRLSALSRQS